MEEGARTVRDDKARSAMVTTTRVGGPLPATDGGGGVVVSAIDNFGQCLSPAVWKILMRESGNRSANPIGFPRQRFAVEDVVSVPGRNEVKKYTKPSSRQSRG